MAKPILIGNWKNHPSSVAEAKDILQGLSKKKLLFKKLSLFIAPPAPYLDIVSQKVKSFAQLGSQDLFIGPNKTYTGAITVDILKSFGVRLAVIGHSERRALGESSEAVAEKARACLKAGIVPVVCVGETVKDTDGDHFEFLREQIKNSLALISKNAASSIMLAYEPSWAIGKSAKDALSPSELAQSIIFIKKVLTDLFGRAAAEKINILYGGSVEPSNAEALMKEGGVAGFLVGHASLKPRSFEEIANAMLQK